MKVGIKKLDGVIGDMELVKKQTVSYETMYSNNLRTTTEFVYRIEIIFRMSDGTAVRANGSDYDEPCDMRMSEQQGTGVIAKAYFDIEEVGYYTDTYSLYVEYEDDPTPHLIAQESFPYEPFGDNEVLSLVALDEDDL